MSVSSSDLVAAFLAKGGNVTKIAEGSRAIENEKDIYIAMREGKKAESDIKTQERADDARQLESEQLMQLACEARNQGHVVVGSEFGKVVVQTDVDDFQIFDGLNEF
jgi:hypothetical protein